MYMKNILLLAAVFAYSTGVGAASVYSIGNSLTENGVPGFGGVALMNGGAPEIGYQIAWGAPLNHIRANPDDISLDLPTIPALGGFAQALPSRAWSAVTIEPYTGYAFGTHDNLASDMANISYFIDLTRSSGLADNTKFYIYEAWPSQTAVNGDYSGFWNQPVFGSQDQPMVFARQYFDRLYNGLSARYGGTASLAVIPIGDVMNRLDIDIAAGLFPGLHDISALYQDDFHINNVGRYMAAITVYATLTGINPETTVIPSWMLAPEGTPNGLTVELAKALQTVVWDVVSNDPRTGVAAVPLPPAFWLLGSALAGMGALVRRRDKLAVAA